MIICKTPTDLKRCLDFARQKVEKIGFVPTMGALHAGHISLIHQAKTATDYVVSSIFVNPTQFNDPKDYEKYPITLESDLLALEMAGCDVLFLPDVATMYPEGLASPIHYELGFIETILDGFYRPGHFQGVCMIVHKLLTLVKPTHLLLGQKDYQQCMVIQKMVDLTQLNVKLLICATQRESDGLAMSSRNVRLDATNRSLAPLLYQNLFQVMTQLKPGPVKPLQTQAIARLAQAGFRVDYFEIADAQSLKSIENWDGQQQLVILVAAFLGDVRLIDNYTYAAYLNQLPQSIKN
jgi:pantoate--beta-alanine ligase